MKQYQCKAIAAISKNGVIGRCGELPWKLSGDLKWFKKITMGHTILMGRKTWDSLPNPLPGRENWVLSRKGSSSSGMRLFRSFEEVADCLLKDQTLFIIGGGEIYTLALPFCRELFITEVHQIVPDGDAFFPPYKEEFKPVEVLEDNPDFLIRRWVRIEKI